MRGHQSVDFSLKSTELDALDAIAALPWVDQLCPLMRHQYAVLRRTPARAWYALDAMIRGSPPSYLAYFRGYQRPNRYWDGPDGLRYWRTRFELNRCTPDSVEPPRRVDEGGRPIPNWVGPPHAPNGAGVYSEDADGRWLPNQRFVKAGYAPCRACTRSIGSSAVGAEGLVTESVPNTPSATRDDLAWWLDLAPSLEWTFASTYAGSAPHWYVVHPRTPELSIEDYRRAGRVIRTFGEPGKFWSMTNLFLFTSDRNRKFWCMWSSPSRDDDDPTLINMATTDRTYGPQNNFDPDRLADLALPPGRLTEEPA